MLDVILDDAFALQFDVNLSINLLLLDVVRGEIEVLVARITHSIIARATLRLLDPTLGDVLAVLV